MKLPNELERIVRSYLIPVYNPWGHRFSMMSIDYAEQGQTIIEQISNIIEKSEEIHANVEFKMSCYLSDICKNPKALATMIEHCENNNKQNKTI